jgi:hypothetical protein
MPTWMRTLEPLLAIALGCSGCGVFMSPKERVVAQAREHSEVVARWTDDGGHDRVVTRKPGDETLWDHVPVPNRSGDGGVGPSLFRFASRDWTERYRQGRATYGCGAAHCDRLAIVARLLPGPVDYGDSSGRVLRAPVFEIERLADRYGVFESRR